MDEDLIDLLNVEKIWQFDRYKALILGVQYAVSNEISGDVGEFGAHSGESARLLAKALSKFCGSRKLHCFDSFRGFPKSEAPGDIDSPLVKSGIWGEGQACAGTKEQVQERCQEFLPEDRVVVYAGWFKDTLSQIPPTTKFSMLHIDCDLYQSTIEVLDYCFSRELVQPGTAIFFDDWNCNYSCPKYGERKAWSEIVSKFSVDFSDWGWYSWHGYKLIVHSYKIQIE